MDALFGNTFVNKLALGALNGFGAAVLIDYAELRKWKSWDDLAAYEWKVASWRWVQGALGGLIAAAGIAGIDAAI